MSNLLYESKDGKNVGTTALSVFGAIFMIMAAAIIWLSLSEDFQRNLLHRYFEHPHGVAAIGVAVLILGSLMLDIADGLSRCWIKIYADSIETQMVSIFNGGNIVRLFRYQIDAVHMQGRFVIIHADEKKIRIVSKDSLRVYELIHEMIKEK